MGKVRPSVCVTSGKRLALRSGLRVLVSRFELLGNCLTLRGVEWVRVW